MKKATKKRTLKRNEKGHFVKERVIVETHPETPTGDCQDNRPEWERLPWNKDLIRMWSSSPEFKAYAEAQGIAIDEGVSELKTSMSGSQDLDIANIAKVVAESVARVMAQQALPTVSSGGAVKGSELVKFPGSILKTVILNDGRQVELEQPLYPINIAGEDYSGDGYYSPEATDRIKEELAEARWVDIPYNAAFVEYTFHRTNDKGKIEKIKEMFTGPGVFACSSLAASIEGQLEKLVSHTLLGGPDAPLIPGTKTQYNDLRTNGVLFVPGFTYEVPKHVAEDLERRMNEHAESFQRVHQERVSLGKQGLSLYSGVNLDPLSAASAVSRQQAGMEPGHIEKVVREGRII